MWVLTSDICFFSDVIALDLYHGIMIAVGLWLKWEFLIPILIGGKTHAWKTWKCWKPFLKRCSKIDKAHTKWLSFLCPLQVKTYLIKRRLWTIQIKLLGTVCSNCSGAGWMFRDWTQIAQWWFKDVLVEIQEFSKLWKTIKILETVETFVIIS